MLKRMLVNIKSKLKPRVQIFLAMLGNPHKREVITQCQQAQGPKGGGAQIPPPSHFPTLIKYSPLSLSFPCTQCSNVQENNLQFIQCKKQKTQNNKAQLLNFLAKFWVTIIIEWIYLTMSFRIMRGVKQRREKKQLQKQNEKW